MSDDPVLIFECLKRFFTEGFNSENLFYASALIKHNTVLSFLIPVIPVIIFAIILKQKNIIYSKTAALVLSVSAIETAFVFSNLFRAADIRVNFASCIVSFCLFTIIYLFIKNKKEHKSLKKIYLFFSLITISVLILALPGIFYITSFELESEAQELSLLKKAAYLSKPGSEYDRRYQGRLSTIAENYFRIQEPGSEKEFKKFASEYRNFLEKRCFESNFYCLSLSWLYLRTGLYEEVIKLTTLNSEHEIILKEYAVYASIMEKDYEEALKITEDIPYTTPYKKEQLKAKIYEHAGDFDKAIEEITKYKNDKPCIYNFDMMMIYKTKENINTSRDFFGKLLTECEGKTDSYSTCTNYEECVKKGEYIEKYTNNIYKDIWK